MKNKRLSRVLSLVLALALLLTGCTTGGDVSNGTTTATTASSNAENQNSFSIYVLNSGITYSNARLNEVYDFYADYKNQIDISISEFSDPEEMKSRLQLELAAGQGPDVIIADVVLGLDMMSLADNGAFYDMTDVIAADKTFTDEKYYTSVMEAGQIDDRQYVIPLSFTLPTFVSTTTALGEMGIDLETDTTIEVYEKLLEHLKASDTPQVSGYQGYADTILALLHSCGKNAVSEETKEVHLDGEEERIIMELGIELYRHWQHWRRGTASSGNPHLDMVQVPIIYTNLFTSPYQLQLYYSGYADNGKADEVEFFFAPDAEGNHHALVQEFAAVSANTKHSTLAWTLIKRIIDDMQTSSVYTPLSLDRDITSRYIWQAKGRSGKINGTSRFKQIPEELANRMLDACETIIDASIYQDSSHMKIFTNGMNAYINHRITFDEMVDDITNKLKLYINE